MSGRGNPVEYILTEQGHDLLPIIVTLMQWGDKWIAGEGLAPVRVVERKKASEIRSLQVQSSTGDTLSLQDLYIVPGPGANDAMRRRFATDTENKPNLPLVIKDCGEKQ